MTHTGYAMVDCTGLNLNTSSEQTITGIYAKAKAAFGMEKGDPTLLNCCSSS